MPIRSTRNRPNWAISSGGANTIHTNNRGDNVLPNVHPKASVVTAPTLEQLELQENIALQAFRTNLLSLVRETCGPSFATDLDQQITNWLGGKRYAQFKIQTLIDKPEKARVAICVVACAYDTHGCCRSFEQRNFEFLNIRESREGSVKSFGGSAISKDYYQDQDADERLISHARVFEDTVILDRLLNKSADQLSYHVKRLSLRYRHGNQKLTWTWISSFKTHDGQAQICLERNNKQFHGNANCEKIDDLLGKVIDRSLFLIDLGCWKFERFEQTTEGKATLFLTRQDGIHLWQPGRNPGRSSYQSYETIVRMSQEPLPAAHYQMSDKERTKKLKKNMAKEKALQEQKLSDEDHWVPKCFGIAYECVRGQFKNMVTSISQPKSQGQTERCFDLQCTNPLCHK